MTDHPDADERTLVERYPSTHQPTTIYDDDDWMLAERYPAMRRECLCNADISCDSCWHEGVTSGSGHHNPHCTDCQGKGYVPNTTTDAMLDVLETRYSHIGFVFPIEGGGPLNAWYCITTSDDTYGREKGGTRHAALVAAVLALPDEARS